MKKLSFDNIKNIEFPESWIEKALNVPSQQPKKTLLPFRYRYAIGFTSCAVLAVLVCLPFLFGMSKEVDLTSPSSGGYTGSEQIAVDSTDGTTPSENTPFAAVQDSTSVTAETEPSGNSAARNSEPNTNNSTSKTKQPAASRSNRNSNPQTSDTNQHNNGTSKPQTQNKSKSSGGSSKNSGSSNQNTEESSKLDTASSVEKESADHSEEKPIEPDPEILEPANDVFAPAQGAGGDDPADLSEKKIYLFQTKIDPYYAAGTVFCVIEKENGEALGDGSLYSSKRTTLKDTVGNKTVLKFYCSCNFVKGRTYTVNFYNSHGEMIKKSNVTINNNFDYEI